MHRIVHNTLLKPPLSSSQKTHSESEESLLTICSSFSPLFFLQKIYQSRVYIQNLLKILSNRKKKEKKKKSETSNTIIPERHITHIQSNSIHTSLPAFFRIEF